MTIDIQPACRTEARNIENYHVNFFFRAVAALSLLLRKENYFQSSAPAHQYNSDSLSRTNLPSFFSREEKKNCTGEEISYTFTRYQAKMYVIAPVEVMFA